MLIPWFILITLYGACVGSFLNVVIYRLPEGKSLIRPGSHCPHCGRKLPWWENIPILAWFYLGGKCRQCRNRISFQYPAVEAATAGLFALTFLCYYVFAGPRGGEQDFHILGFFATWPVLLVHLTLLAGLIAATMIDARLYIIPLPIPWLATVVALLLPPVALWLAWMPAEQAVTPLADGRWLLAMLGAGLGLLLSLALLQMKFLPRSFDDLEEQVTEPMPPEQFPDHPHPRREVVKEMLFLAPPLAGAAIGWLAGGLMDNPAEIAPALQALGGIMLGYFVGAGLIWVTRILGTLAFGKEAMGLGDVHLLAAIGAVVGAADVVLVFFIAPFMGLLATLIMSLLHMLGGGQVRVIPYGPYLAAAAAVMMLARQPIVEFVNIMLFGY